MDQLQTIEPEITGQRALFDYSALDQETQVLVRLRAGEIKSLAKRVASDIVEIGGKLAEVKDRVGGNGRFNDWLSAELAWSERTAHNFIAVWQKFNAANFALENVATSALYLLAAPSTPAEALEVAKQIADSGEKVSHGLAKEIVRQAKARKPKQAELIEEPEPEEEVEEDDAEEAPSTDEEIAVCLCGHRADQHDLPSNCTKCPCESFEVASEADIAERQAVEKTLGIGEATPAPAATPAPVSAQKPAAVKTPSTPDVDRLAAWYKTRVEITITLMPGGDASTRKVMHSVRAGEEKDDFPFVLMATGEDALFEALPPITRGLFEKAYESFAKKRAAKATAKKPTTKSKPAPKKPAPKTKAKGGKK